MKTTWGKAEKAIAVFVVLTQLITPSTFAQSLPTDLDYQGGARFADLDKVQENSAENPQIPSSSPFADESSPLSAPTPETKVREAELLGIPPTVFPEPKSVIKEAELLGIPPTVQPQPESTREALWDPFQEYPVQPQPESTKEALWDPFQEYPVQPQPESTREAFLNNHSEENDAEILDAVQEGIWLFQPL